MYNQPNNNWPTESQYDREYEINERKRTIEYMVSMLDSFFPTDNPDVMEHVNNAKVAIIERDQHHFGISVHAACRLLGTQEAIEDTDQWAEQYAQETKDTLSNALRGIALTNLR